MNSLNYFIYIYNILNREEKQGDLAEQLESVAYVLCGDQPISLQKFYQIFQAKGVSKTIININTYANTHKVFIFGLKFISIKRIEITVIKLYELLRR